MSKMLRKGAWLPVNCVADDGLPNDATMMPLGLCAAFGTDDAGKLLFTVRGGGDPEWMRHVVTTLGGLGVAFFAGITGVEDAFDLNKASKEQFVVVLAQADCDAFMPKVKQAYDIAEALLGASN